MFNKEYFVVLALGGKIKSSEIEDVILERIKSTTSYQTLTDTERKPVLYQVAFQTLAYDHVLLLNAIYKLHCAIDSGNLEEASSILKELI